MTRHAQDCSDDFSAGRRGGPDPARRRDRGSTGLAEHGPVDDPVVTARALFKVFGRGENAVTALDGVDVSIARARFTAIMGPSGSGKSTLMHCLAGLESATSGTIALDGQEITSMSQRRLTRLRRERIGFVFQSFNLVPSLTAGENITLPLDIARRKVERSHFDQVVEAVGLSDRLSHRPAELSGGQVPAVVFADEPTGNLDSRATEQVLRVLRSSVDDFDQSVVMVTHEAEAAAWADTVLFLRDGRVVAEMNDPDRDRVLEALHDLGSPGGGSIGRGRSAGTAGSTAGAVPTPPGDGPAAGPAGAQGSAL